MRFNIASLPREQAWRIWEAGRAFGWASSLVLGELPTDITQDDEVRAAIYRFPNDPRRIEHRREGEALYRQDFDFWWASEQEARDAGE